MELFSRGDWQMALGERAAIAGVLAQLRPRLSIELGTAEGGSLRTIAAWSDHVHSFDFAPAVADPPPNVTLHRGDSHVLLPLLLRELERAGEEVDFVLVDGDHSADGVRRDVEDLLASAAVRSTVILLHDTANEHVRRGVRAVDFARHPKVRLVDLAFVELQRSTGALREEWGGLGLIVVDGAGNEPAVMRNIVRRPSPLRRALAPARTALRRAHDAVQRTRQ